MKSSRPTLDEVKPRDRYHFDHYLRSALAGGICCCVTHSALCPLDVVKTRIQLRGATSPSLLQATRMLVQQEGWGVLATGLGPTAAAYLLQGWWKFGGVEFFKIHFASLTTSEQAWRYRTPIYLVSAACAETIADIFLCPLESTRIRLVSNPSFAKGLIDAFPKIWRQDGFIRGFYSGLVPILFKQVPYSMAKFAVQGAAAEALGTATGRDKRSTAVTLASGTVAGVAAAIVSHPADTLLSLVNRRPDSGGTGSIPSRLSNLAREHGFKRLCLTGLGARCVMIGTLTAAQFGVFEYVMQLTGAKSFHFDEPRKPQTS
jgi:solute carrier family 25 phosphate transporter 3